MRGACPAWCPSRAPAPVPAPRQALLSVQTRSSPPSARAPKPRHSQLTPMPLWSLGCVAQGTACKQSGPSSHMHPPPAERGASTAPFPLRAQSPATTPAEQWGITPLWYRLGPHCPSHRADLGPVPRGNAVPGHVPRPWGRVSLLTLGTETPLHSGHRQPLSAGADSINPVTGTGLCGSPTGTGSRRPRAGNSRGTGVVSADRCCFWRC